MDGRDSQQNNDHQYVKNLTFAGVAGLAGLITLLIVLISMILGIWLDNLLGTNHGFTIGLILGSVPLTVFVMLKFVRWATARIKPQINQISFEEDDNSGKTP
jgi:sterol desaturase/sphingolipid hydroxylase (fatty acid hydroxylase superfamily)